MAKASEHAGILDVCLPYLSSDALKAPRFPQGRASNLRKVKRSQFAAYADRLVRASPADSTHLIALNNFLTTNPLTWIEMLARHRIFPHTSGAEYGDVSGRYHVVG